MTPSELLRKAAGNITAETWCQGNLWRDRKGEAVNQVGDVCQFCAIGALKLAAGAIDAFDWPDGVSKVIRKLSAHTQRVSLASWNDAPGRTHTEVSALFLKVAEELESKEVGK